eukprot:588802-Alexandrium_andersonii.AAC.1
MLTKVWLGATSEKVDTNESSKRLESETPIDTSDPATLEKLQAGFKGDDYDLTGAMQEFGKAKKQRKTVKEKKEKPEESDCKKLLRMASTRS